MQVLRELVGTAQPIVNNLRSVWDDSDIGFGSGRDQLNFRHCLQTINTSVEQSQTGRPVDRLFAPGVVRTAEEQCGPRTICVRPTIEQLLNSATAGKPAL